jgi:cytochrome P450
MEEMIEGRPLPGGKTAHGQPGASAGLACERPEPSSADAPDVSPPRVKLEQIRHVPGKFGLPLVGAYPEALLSPLTFARRMYERYGPVHRFYATGNWNVQLISPEANALVLLDKDQIFSSKQGWAPVLGPYFSGGLLLRDFEDHRAQRKYIGAAFRRSVMPGFLASFRELSERAVARWSGLGFDFYSEIRKLLLESAALTFFGLPLGPQGTAVAGAFDRLVSSLVAFLPASVPWSAAAKGSKGRRFLSDFIADELPKRRGREGGDLFSQLCNVTDDDGRYLSVDAVTRHMIFVLAAAHDTLAAGLSGLVYYLGLHQQWQRKVRDELRDLGPPGDQTPDSLAGASLSEWAIKEAFRLNSPAPILWRRALRPYSVHGFELPAGTMTAINPLMTHRLDEYWPEPDAFLPERFDESCQQDRPKFAYIPFGAGPHACLGLHYSMMQAKIFASVLLRDHRIAVPERYEPLWYYWPHCRPLNGLPVRLERTS